MRATTTDRRIGLLLSFLLGGVGLGAIFYMAVHHVSFGGTAAVLVAFGSMVWAVRRSTTWPPIPTKTELESKPEPQTR